MKIAEVDHAIDFIVRSLKRDIAEGMKAVELLLELSKDMAVREQIGKVQGCILLLVTMSNSDNPKAAKGANEVMENLPYSEHNVVQMAQANYFKPSSAMAKTQTWMRRGSNPKLEQEGEGKYGAFLVSQTITTAPIIAAWYSSNIGVLLLNKCLLSFLDTDTQYSSQCCTCVPIHFIVFWQLHD